MNVLTLKKAGIDYEKGVARFQGRKEIYERMLLRFASKNYLMQMEQAYDERDYEQLRFLLHTLKGTAASLGIEELDSSCYAISSAIKDERWSDLQNMFQGLKEKLERIIEAIKTSQEGDLHGKESDACH